MKEIVTEIIINAPIEKIWSKLLDFNAYPSWNPFIRKLEGEAIVGAKLVVTIQPEGQKPMVFKPRVLTTSDYHFSWIGQVGFSGIFDGEHNFKLVQEPGGQVKFIHFEKFSGILSSPIFAMIGKSTTAGFLQMNQALKACCETPG